MAVITTKGRNTLGTLSTLGYLAGMATNTPWLSSLGLSMGAVGNMINGKDPTTNQSAGLADMIKRIETWINPAKDNPAKVDLTDEELAKKWNPYLDTKGYYGWGWGY